MEGLIPFIYKAIVQYRNGEQAPLPNSWFDEAHSAHYTQLSSGDSGRFRSLEIQFFSSSAQSPPPATGKHSPLRRPTSRRQA
ncbi:hypothetical protein COCNU_04G015550 [Cocos nucifera]|uniref:Uncharacterized protein n=1 Tax=Cocos nucifera TaxID=13894 RepID=A0A8K0I7V2_COCNU|nr:hypothetical protein COCNU_04G015550 [Cocos nucifera]